MKQYILENPTLVAVMCAIVLIALIAWNDPLDKKEAERQKEAIDPAEMKECYDNIMTEIHTAATEKDLEQCKRMNGFFKSWYGHTNEGVALHSKLCENWNAQKDFLEPIRRYNENLSSEYLDLNEIPTLNRYGKAK